MAFSFLASRVLAAEVTAGIDIESRVILSGERVTIGTGAGDTLRLGAPNVVPGHLTFQRAQGSSGWEYATSDRGHTTVDRGNPRTGLLRPGMWFVLGGATRIEIVRTAGPAGPRDTLKSAESKTVPLTIALPIMALLVAASIAVLRLNAGSNADEELSTAAWFTGNEPIDGALEACLASGLSPETRALGAAAVAGDQDALFRTALTAPAASAGAATVRLASEVLGIIAESHLLAREGRNLDASFALRRLENVLPVGNGDCPILRAARIDLAILELMGSTD